EAHDRRADQGRPARAGEGDDRRRAGEPGVRRRDRRRRLRSGFHARGGEGQGPRRGRGGGRLVKARGWDVLERVRAGERLVFDGGYGTMLFAAGLANGACPEVWNDTHADVVRALHQGYFDAGSQSGGTTTCRRPPLPLDEA